MNPRARWPFPRRLRGVKIAPRDVLALVLMLVALVAGFLGGVAEHRLDHAWYAVAFVSLVLLGVLTLGSDT